MTVPTDGSAVDQASLSDRARAREPDSLTALIVRRIGQLPDGSRQRAMLQGVLNAHSANLDRRAAVLRYPDLARRLTGEPLKYARPEQWNGYVPPPVAVDDDGGVLREVKVDGRVRFNQLGKRSCGVVFNDSLHRALLLEISAEAWKRDHADN